LHDNDSIKIIDKNNLLSSLPPNFSLDQKSNNKDSKNIKNKNIDLNSNCVKIEQKSKKKKNGNNRDVNEDNWDEIENMLNDFKQKDKNVCNFFGCGSKNEVRDCVFCIMNYCNQHIRQPIHECSYLKNMPNYNADYYKNKVSQKIELLEKDRNKKEKQKKK